MSNIILFLLIKSLFHRLTESIIIDNFTMSMNSSNILVQRSFDLTQNVSETVYINQKDGMKLSCTASGDSIYVALLKDDKEVNRNFLRDGEAGTISVVYMKSSVDCYDSGRYKCRSGNKDEWPSITRTIVVKCPMLPVKFRSNNVNAMNGSTDLIFVCERHKDVSDSFLLSIKKNGQTLRSTNMTSSINLTFPRLTCSEMGTYTCETVNMTNGKQLDSRSTDLFVHYCPPIINLPKKSVKVDKGVINISLKAVLPDNKLTTFRTIYQTYRVAGNKCSDKLCIKVKSLGDKWRKQIRVTIKKIKELDLNRQMIRFCYETMKQLHCSNVTFNVKSPGRKNSSSRQSNLTSSPYTVSPSETTVTFIQHGLLSGSMKIKKKHGASKQQTKVEKINKVEKIKGKKKQVKTKQKKIIKKSQHKLP